MFNEKTIRKNITCNKMGGFEVYQALWILAGAKGKLTQEDIELEWHKAEEDWKHQQEFWRLQDKLEEEQK